jgi:hypothetical protein
MENPGKSREELLTEQFYEWERRGRGWQLWDRPVWPEPPFKPFFFHYVPSDGPIDDGRRLTFVGSLIAKAKGLLSEKPEPAAAEESEEEEGAPALDDDYPDIVEFSVALPATQVITREATEQFLLSLGYAGYPMALEIIGLSDRIVLQMVCGEPDSAQLRQQIEAYFPDAVVSPQNGFLEQSWRESGAGESVIADFGLSNEFMLPIKTFGHFNVDPLIAVTGALSNLEKGEIGILQIIFQPVSNPWANSIMRAVADNEGRAFFADAPHITFLAEEKVSKPLFAAVIRVAAGSQEYERSLQIAKALGGALNQFTDPDGNELMPLANYGYPDDEHGEDLFARRSRRSGMILNSEELISLVHFPSTSVRSEKLVRDERRTKAAPTVALGHNTVIGENLHNGKKTAITLSPQQRIQHTYIIGASGTGKSTLLLNMIIQDIQNGEGVGVLDPHGDLIDKMLGYIPENRISDVILFDPSDEDFPIGFNILSAHSEQEKTLLSSDLVAGFRRLSTSWGDQMTSVLGNAILAFLESEKGGTLADLRRFLVERDFRQSFLETVKDQQVVYYWQKEFPLLVGKPQGPLLTRLDTFLRPKLIRHMICQKENRLDFRKIMDDKKIFLAKLAQGAVGEENSYLLGTLIVSKIHQMTMGRQEISEAKRQNFFLYIDEFHNFITPSMASILSGARKYRLGLVLAHQELRQLWNKDTDVASAVISNPYTRICFRCGDFDAQKLKDGFSFFESKDLQNLGTGQAIVRIEKAEYDFNLKTFPLPAVDAETARKRQEQIVAFSRNAYASRREEVEKLLFIEEPIKAISAEPIKREFKKPQEAAIPEQKEKPVQKEIKEAVPKKPAAKPEVPVSIPSTPGRGGQQHKYLQQLIKKLAEEKGYKATIEKEILGGTGSVDVSLEKEKHKIACEINITSTDEQELGNIQKCLAAGYDRVIMISAEKKILIKIRRLVEDALEKTSFEKVSFLTPEGFVSFLEEREARAASTEKTVKGYKVKVKFKPMAEEEKKTRRETISHVVLKAIHRLSHKK